jgi:hypothetical protein
MIELGIRFDPSPLVETLSGLRDALPLVRTRVLNRSGATTHTFAARTLAGAMRLSNKVIRGGIKVTQASVERPEWRMEISGKRLPLILFKPKRDPLGIRALLPDGSDFFRRAFLATMPSGHRGVFQRVTFGPGSKPARRGKNRAWLPIREVKTWSRARAFTEIDGIADSTERVARDALVKNLQADVRFMLTRKRIAKEAA